MKIYVSSTYDDDPTEPIRMSDALINPICEEDNRLYGPFDTTDDMWRSIFDEDEN